MTKELSALLDDELEFHEEAVLWASLKAEPMLRETWRSYQLIGDAVRDEMQLQFDITHQVMASLQDEPVVFAPVRRQQVRTWQNAIWAIAASAAGVAVVAWVALSPSNPGAVSVPQMTAANDAKVQVVSAVPANGSANMQEYVLAHQANAHGYLPGGAQHIRTVSMAGGAK